MDTNPPSVATRRIDVRETFGFESKGLLREVHALAEPSEFTPAIDPGYHFNPAVTLALLSRMPETAFGPGFLVSLAVLVVTQCVRKPCLHGK